MHVNTDERIIKKLGSYANRWGGGLLAVTLDVFCGFTRCRGFSHAQYTCGELGVLYLEKLIVYVPNSAPEVEPVSLVHEMGHVFASRSRPNSSKEFGFFGWEYMLCQRVGITIAAWRKSHANYRVGSRGNYCCIKDMSENEYEKMIGQAVRHAARFGLIVDGEPVSIRDLEPARFEDLPFFSE